MVEQSLWLIIHSFYVYVSVNLSFVHSLTTGVRFPGSSHMSYGKNIYNLNERSIFPHIQVLGPYSSAITFKESISFSSLQAPEAITVSVFQVGLPDDARVLHHRDVLSPDRSCCGGMELIASHHLKIKGNLVISGDQHLRRRKEFTPFSPWNRAFSITGLFRWMMGNHGAFSLQTKHEKYKLTCQDSIQKTCVFQKRFLQFCMRDGTNLPKKLCLLIVSSPKNKQFFLL